MKKVSVVLLITVIVLGGCSLSGKHAPTGTATTVTLESILTPTAPLFPGELEHSTSAHNSDGTPRGVSNPTSTPESTEYSTDQSTSGVVFGIYDPEDHFAGDQRVRIEEVFHPWRLDDASEIMASVNRILREPRLPLIAIEPWSWNGYEGLGEKTLLPDIASGKYDSSIKTLCSALGGKAPQEIWVRWGYEMDLTGLNPWSTDKPQEYVAAYQHFVSQCRKEATNLKFIWSPAGNSNASDFWPGSEYVDIVGMSIFGYREYDLAHSGKVNSFTELFQQKYSGVEKYGKPVIIAEMGVSGDRTQQSEWLQDASHTFSQFPLLKAIIYFNAQNPKPWEPGFLPDWRVDASSYPP